MNAHNEQQARSLLALGLDEFGHHTEAENVRNGIDLDDYKVDLWAIRAALDTQPAAAQEAVAYLDIGAGGYLDLGSDLSDEQLLALPKGRHALAIIGTCGIDGYVNAAAPVTAAPVDLDALAVNRYRPVPDGLLAYKVVAGDGTRSLFSGTMNECNVVARKLTEAFLDGAHVASTPAAPGIDRMQTPIGWSDTDFIALGNPIDLRIFRKAVLRWKLFSELGVDVESMPMHFLKSPLQYADDLIEANRLLALIDASPKELAFLQAVAGLEFDAPMDTVVQDSPKGGSEACERIAAILHQEATDEPWTVCGVEHDGPDRAYYRELARRVLDAAQAGDAEVQP